MSAEEVARVLGEMGWAGGEEAGRRAVEEADIDGNGRIEFAEFVILMAGKTSEMSKEDEIFSAFKMLSKDKST